MLVSNATLQRDGYLETEASPPPCLYPPPLLSPSSIPRGPSRWMSSTSIAVLEEVLVKE